MSASGPSGPLVFGGGVVSIANNCWYFMPKMVPPACLHFWLLYLSYLCLLTFKFHVHITKYQSLAQIRIWFLSNV